MAGAQVLFTDGAHVLTPDSVLVASSGQITGGLDLHGATPGLYDVVVKNPGPGAPSGVLADGLTISNPTPKVSSIVPNAGFVDETLSISITGSNFVAGAQVLFTDGAHVLTPNSVLVASSGQITGGLDLHGATPGLYDVVVKNPGPGVPSGVLVDGLTISNPKPKVSSIVPNAGFVNEMLSFSITGSNFVAGAQVLFTDGAHVLTPNSVLVASSGQITGGLDLHGATPGLYDVVVKTGPGAPSSVLADGLTISNPKPKVSASFRTPVGHERSALASPAATS